MKQIVKHAIAEIKNCPLDNKCLINKIVYKAEIEINNGTNELSTKFYFGINETEFKSRYNNHTMSFRNRTHENDIDLSKSFLKNLLDIAYIKIVKSLVIRKTSNMQFQRKRQVTQ